METDQIARREQVKTRFRQIGIGAGALLLGFLIGWAVQLGPKRAVETELDTAQRELEATRAELRMHGLQTRIGAALAEALRGNYERGRQLMSSFYQDLEAAAPSVTAPAAQEAIRQAVRERDEMITLLSRAAPESAQRLTMLYTRLYLVFDELGRRSPGMVTPPLQDTTDTGAGQ